MNKKQKTRINLLSTTEIDELYSIPIFNKKDPGIGSFRNGPVNLNSFPGGLP